jgi:hypothetical protein
MKRILAAAAVLLIAAGSACAADQPMRVRFETGGGAPKIGASVPVTLVVERPDRAASEVALTLRVPAGFKLTGENWSEVPQPVPAGEEPVWRVHEWRGPIDWRSGDDGRQSARVPVYLEAVDNGTNYVISAQAVSGNVKASGVVLATVQNELATFHATPFKNPLPVEAFYTKKDREKEKKLRDAQKN